MTTPGPSLTSTQERVAKQFPAILTLAPEVYAKLVADEHALMAGDRARMQLLYEKLDHRRRILEAAGYSAQDIHEILLHVLHAFFVGDLNDASREMMPMYAGTSGDFDLNLERWRRACENVEQTFEHVLCALPPTLRIERTGEVTTVLVRDQLTRSARVRTHDAIKLLELVRAAGPQTPDWHMARVKLGMAQFMFEAISNGYAPEDLDRQREAVDGFLGRRLFMDPRGRQVTIVADLDPANDYRCVSYRQHESIVMLASVDHQRQLSAREFKIRLPDGREIEVLYSSRAKQHLFLKALTKGQRFIQLNGLGDGIGLMFVVDHEDLDAFVRAVRQVLVPCPGSVCDQASTIGHRNGRGNDPDNRHTSRDYEVMKYNALVCGRVIEVQFVPMKAWIDARCAHSDVNHRHYKMRQMLTSILPILFPTHLFGIDWEHPSIREQCFAHAITLNE